MEHNNMLKNDGLPLTPAAWMLGVRQLDALSFLDEELQSLKDQGLYRVPRTLSGQQRARCVFDGRSVVNLSSNNYLGLASHPKMVEAAVKATQELGVGSGAVRTIAGQMDLHKQLEKKLAEFKHVEACLVFQSGFTANAGTVSCILGREDVIISDELNHASIIDGCRLSRAQIKVYPHSDMDGLRQALEEAEGRRKLVVTDGVFSMDGDIAPLPEVVKLAKEYGAAVMVDDAHASGVLGRNGRGTVDHYDLHGQVDIQVGTLSKAVGVLGGYVAGPQKLIDYLVQRARPVLFSNATEDTWANPAGQFDVLKAAEPVYRLFGAGGLDADGMPHPPCLIPGRLGYFLREGKHSMTAEDWDAFLAFADRWL